MKRGTTQQLTFILPEEISIAALFITFRQNNRTVLEKSLEDVTVDGKKITFQLSQEDTLKFCAPHALYIQLRIRDTLGNAVASEIIRTDAEVILKEGVI